MQGDWKWTVLSPHSWWIEDSQLCNELAAQARDIMRENITE